MKEFQGFNHGKKQVDLSHLKVMAQLRPTEVHLKEDGSIEDKPSLCFVMVDGSNFAMFGQISVDMFNEGLADIGYKLVKL
jgi:hypothetical protein